MRSPRRDPGRNNSAAVAVLTSDVLMRRAAEFQCGYPQTVASLLVGVDSVGLHYAWGRAFGPQRTLDGALSRLVVAVGDTRMLRLLFDLKASPQYQSDPLVNFSHVMRTAVELQRVDMLECIAELKMRDPTWQWEPHLMSNAVNSSQGDLSVLAWLDAHLPHESREITSRCINGAAHRGDLQVIRWICEHGYTNMASAADCAASGGSIGVLEYLYQHTDVRCSPREVCQAAERSIIEIVKIAAQNQSAETLERALDAATRRGRLEVVQYFVECGIGANSKNVIDGAAQEGHLSVVKYLHEHLARGCTWLAMHSAALHGHLDVVKFLHENRTEGCTSATMNGAAARGLLDIVKFLHENRTEGCTTKAMDCAAAHGHLDVVTFLHENRDEGCSTAALQLAAVNKHFGVVGFLCEHRPECDIGGVMTSAASDGDVDVVKTLYKYSAAWASAYAALKAAAQKRRTSVLRFLCEHQVQTDESHSFLVQAVMDKINWLVKAVLPYFSTAELENARVIARDQDGVPQILQAIEKRIKLTSRRIVE